MAYRLAGRDGYERVRASDEKHIAPGADTIRELFGGQPTLILLDEISVYLRKVERAFPDASKQFAAFIHDLFKAVASTPQVALVYTLAVGKDDKAGDAYKEENERAAAAMAEAGKRRRAKHHAAQPHRGRRDAQRPPRPPLRIRRSRRRQGGRSRGYAQVWNANRDALPADAAEPELRDQFAPQLPAPSQAARNADRKDLRRSARSSARAACCALLARTIHHLWRTQPPDALRIHTHHIDPAFEPIRTEINVKLGQGQYAPRRQIRCRRRRGRRARARAAHRRPEVSRPAAGYRLRRAHDLLAHARLWRFRQGHHRRAVEVLRLLARPSSRPSSSRRACSSSPIPSTWTTARARLCASWSSRTSP